MHLLISGNVSFVAVAEKPPTAVRTEKSKQTKLNDSNDAVNEYCVLDNVLRIRVAAETVVHVCVIIRRNT